MILCEMVYWRVRHRHCNVCKLNVSVATDAMLATAKSGIQSEGLFLLSQLPQPSTWVIFGLLVTQIAVINGFNFGAPLSKSYCCQ